jgi:hypothetical protein
VAHVYEPDSYSEARDQREFDDAVDRKGKYVLAALAGLGVFAAVLMSAIALINSGGGSSPAASAAQARQPSASTPAAATSVPVAAKAIDLKVIPTYKVGPDGKKHDAFTQTEFAVKVGQPLKLRIDNTDEGEHSITAPAIGVNIVVKPGVHTYTLVVHQAGRFQWYCMIPCDSDANGWAMQNPGFMSGYITAS